MRCRDGLHRAKPFPLRSLGEGAKGEAPLPLLIL